MWLFWGLLLVVSLIGLAVLLEKRYEAAHGASLTGEGAESASLRIVNTLTNQMAAGVHQLRNHLERKQTPQVVQAFAVWVSASLGHAPGLQAWITALPAPALQALVDQTAIFCAEMNLNLAWLVEQQLEDEPVLKQAATDMVVAYCTACWKAVDAQPELQVFGTYQRFLQDPDSRQYRVLRRRLLAQLIEQGLATAPPAADLILAAEDERQRYAVAAIQQAAQQHPAAFRETLAAVVLTLDGAEAGGVSTESPPTQPA